MAAISEKNTWQQETNSTSDSVSKTLSVHLILTEIFSCLSISDLKSCRLVCQTTVWFETCTAVLRKKCAPVQLGLKSPLIRKQVGNRLTSRRCQGLAESKWIVAIKNLIDLIHNSKDFPCSKFIVPTNLLVSAAQHETLKEFWVVIGNFVTFIQSEYIHTSLRGQNILCTVSFPNLEVLSLGFGHLKDFTEDDLQFLQEILNHAPRLNNLQIGCTESTTALAVCLDMLTRCNLHGRIKSLSILGPIEDIHIFTLQKLNLKLENLSLGSYVNSNFQTENFQSFWLGQRESVKSLKLDCWCLPQCVMRVVTKFDFNVEILMIQPVDFSLGPLPQVFPVLRELVLRGSILTNKLFLSCGNHLLETLKTLRFLGNRIKPEVILRGAEVFPNIRKLQVMGRLKMLHAVNLVMPNLYELILNGKGAPDSEIHKVLTGYSKEELGSVKIFWTEQGEIPIIDSGKEPMTVMQNIKILRLQQVNINDLICFLGPMKMKSLQCLDLSKNIVIPMVVCRNRERLHPHTEISSNVVDKMRQRFIVLLEEQG